MVTTAVPGIAMNHRDGDTPMTSKKFIAYLLAEITWKAIIALLVVSGKQLGDNVILLTVVLITGFIEVAYILGQAYIDRYVKIADMAFDKMADATGATKTTETDGGAK